METPPSTPPRRNSAPIQVTPPSVSRRKSAPSRVVLTDTPMTPPRRKSSPKFFETEVSDDSPMHFSTRPNIRPQASSKVSPEAVQDDLEEKGLLPVIDDAINQYVDEAMNEIVNDKFSESKNRKSVKSTSIYSDTKLMEKINRMRRAAQDKKRNAARKAYELAGISFGTLVKESYFRMALQAAFSVVEGATCVVGAILTDILNMKS